MTRCRNLLWNSDVAVSFIFVPGEYFQFGLLTTTVEVVVFPQIGSLRIVLVLNEHRRDVECPHLPLTNELNPDLTTCSESWSSQVYAGWMNAMRVISEILESLYTCNHTQRTHMRTPT